MAIAGSPLFMSPECLRGKVVPKSDVWAVGITAFELAERRLPHQDAGNLVRIMRAILAQPAPTLSGAPVPGPALPLPPGGGVASPMPASSSSSVSASASVAGPTPRSPSPAPAPAPFPSAAASASAAAAAPGTGAVGGGGCGGGFSWTSDFHDFVAQCLVKDPQQRPSAAELLHHRWFQAQLGVTPELNARLVAGDAAAAAALARGPRSAGRTVVFTWLCFHVIFCMTFLFF